MWSENELTLVPQKLPRFMWHFLWKCYDVLIVPNLFYLIMHLKYVIILFTTLLIKTKLSCLTFVININIAMCLFVIKAIWYNITRWMLLMQWLCHFTFPVVYITLIYDPIHLVDQYIIKVISHSHSCLLNRTSTIGTRYIHAFSFH